MSGTMSATGTTSRVRAEFHELSVAEVTPLCDDAVAVTFDVPPELQDIYAFRPGQSVVLRRFVDGREERRNYSICAPDGEQLRIGVRAIPDGLFSTWLVREVRAGDRVEVSTPTGTFTPRSEGGRHHVLVVAGSGITPSLSIAASLLRDPACTVTLFYGNRRASTVMFAEELADLKDRYPARFHLAHVLSREPREAELFSGRLDAEKLRALLPLTVAADHVDEWWLCGPFAMVTDAEELLAELGVPRDRTHHELFYVGDAPPPPVDRAEPALEGATSDVTAVLDGRSSTVSVPQGVSVLEGAQRARPDLPFACKGGVCGTCRARLVSGEVHMRRNYALEDTEVEAGFVLTCQSIPVTAQVTVDYDH